MLSTRVSIHLCCVLSSGNILRAWFLNYMLDECILLGHVRNLEPYNYILLFRMFRTYEWATESDAPVPHLLCEACFAEFCFRCPCVVRCRSAAVWLLGSWVWIPLREWIFVSCVYCVGTCLCDDLIALTEESHRLCVSVSDIETSTTRGPRPEMGCGATDKEILLRTFLFGDYIVQRYPKVFPIVNHLTLLYNTAKKTIQHFTIVLRKISVETRARLFFVSSLRKVHWVLMCATAFT
jgi:hypothetical protein